MSQNCRIVKKNTHICNYFVAKTLRYKQGIKKRLKSADFQ